MKKLLRTGLAAIAVAFFLGACANGKTPEGQQHSGFLKDYSQLKQEKDAAGDPVLRHISPQLSSGNYRQIMIDPVDFYPKPEPSDNVDSATLNEIKTYLDQQLRKKIGERVPVVDKPGPGVVRMRPAITAIAQERAGLKPYQYLPVALMVTAAGEAAGLRAKDVAIQAEVELLDSVSGQPLGAAVKKGTGESVKGGEGSKLALAHVKPVLDKWAQVAADFAASSLRAR